MTVRWKPLIVLSGLFLIVAAVGLLAIAVDFGPGGATEILAQARAEARAGRYPQAEIHYKRALQKDPRAAKVHEEFARLYADWAAADPEQAAALRTRRRAELADAAKFGKTPEPRRQLLLEALAHQDADQAAVWARKLIELEPEAPDAHYALAAAALEDDHPDPAAARPHLEALAAREPARPRTEWLRVRQAELARDDAGRAAALDRARSLRVAPGGDATDRAALLKLRALDALATTDPAGLAGRCTALADEARAQAEGGEAGADAEALVGVGRQLDAVLKHLTAAREAGDERTRSALDPCDEALGRLAEACFQKALKDPRDADMRVYEEYAAHLLERDERARCLEAVEAALKLPAAKLPAWQEAIMRLHELGLKAALLDGRDPNRFAQADPHIQALISSNTPGTQAVGHLFQGVVELDRAGLADAAAPAGGDPRLRASALGHLKRAAAGLPDSGTAQALYGVALLLTGEPALGRQYLSRARRLPNLEPRYRLWSAWAMVQAGYPEEAEPDVNLLLAGLEKGQVARDLEPSLRLLVGEIYQARRSPDDLRRAREAYQQAIDAGQPATPALELRLAQLDVMLGQPARGLERIDDLRKRGDGGPDAEHLAVLVLADQKHDAEARRTLDEARRRYPDSGMLAGLDAALWLEAKDAERADRVLADYLQAHPKDLDVLQLRARLLADHLRKPDEARALLLSAAEGAETSSPLVQLALIDLARNDPAAAAATIAKIRGRWKEAAAADLLDAQLSLAKQDPRAALAHLDEALKKDPSNKLALFWKAQLDDKAGSPAEAAKIYESIARANPVKELDDGLSLATAANWALAAMELENQDIDGAITRLEGLLKADIDGHVGRPVRWQLVAARAAKGQWPEAEKEIRALLADKDTTPEEIVRAANFHRLHGDPAYAAKLLDGVLKADPKNSAALAIRAFLLADQQPQQAAALVRRGIAAGDQPPSLYLMLAALENKLPPKEEAARRAMEAVEGGLKAHPDSIELVQAKYELLRAGGDAKAGLAYVEARAQDDPKGLYRRFLVDIHRAERRPEQAEAVLRNLLEDFPKDAALAAALVNTVAAQAIDAGRRGDRKAEQARNAETAGLIRRFRAEFAGDATFLQAEAELAARGGQLDRALALSREIDALDKASPLGPMLRAQIAAARGWAEGVAREYADAVERAPRRADLRLASGEANLAAGRPDEALKQAEWLLQADDDSPAALLLKARALARRDGTPAEAQAHRAEAIETLRKAVADRPQFAAGRHLLAELLLQDGRRDAAVAALKDGLGRTPKDPAGVAITVQALTEPRPDGTPAPAEALSEAEAVAARCAAADGSGEVAMAAAMGFHKAGHLDRALPWAERAVERLDSWVAHQNYGDLLLARAEATPDRAEARRLFERVDAAYAKVLAEQADSVEAINNRAWVLHQYLDRAPEALALCEGLGRRVDRSTLPPDFFDTLGSIHEAMGKSAEAEAAYAEGLRRAPDHAALNYHMGRLLLADPARAATARGFLDKARAARGTLPPAMASDLETLSARSGR